MRDRLVELILQSDPIKERDLDDEWYDGEIEDIADHLLANGVIVPPCKVGDTVYMIYWDDGIEPFIEEDKIIKVSTQKFWLKYCYFNYDDIGKTVFLTRDEAEMTLEEFRRKRGEEGWLK